MQASLGPVDRLGAAGRDHVQHRTGRVVGDLPARALSAHDKATLDTTRVSLGGLHLSQAACGLLGVLAISSEYTSGLIRTTLSAVP